MSAESAARWAGSPTRAIADAGFHVLVFDTRAAAEFNVSGKETPCFYDEVCQAADVLAAVRHLRARGAKTIAIIGGSMGGVVVAQAAVDAGAGEIDRLVLLAPAEVATPEKIQGRKLFLIAREDANSAGLRLPRIRAQLTARRHRRAWSCWRAPRMASAFFRPTSVTPFSR